MVKKLYNFFVATVVVCLLQATAISAVKTPEEMEHFFKRNPTATTRGWRLFDGFNAQSAGEYIATLAGLPLDVNNETVEFMLHVLLKTWIFDDNSDAQNWPKKIEIIMNYINKIDTPRIKLALLSKLLEVIDLLLVENNKNQNPITASTLLKCGANVNIRTKNSKSLFHFQGLTGKLYDIYLQGGLKPDVTNASGKTPMQYAIRHKFDALFDLLLKKGVNIHNRDKKKNSYIVTAVKAGNVYALRKLFKTGVDVNAPIGSGTILQLTEKYSKIEKKALITIILGQQPADLTGLTNQKAYRDLIMATTEPLLKKQIDLWSTECQLTPLIAYGTPKQFMYTAQELKKKNNGIISPTTLSDSRVLQSQKNIDSFSIGTILASLCIMALKQDAYLSFFRLLSLCAQQRVVDQTLLSPDKKELTEPEQSLLNEIHGMPYLHAALELIRVQEQLNKIRGKNNKSTGQLKDITIRFKKF